MVSKTMKMNVGEVLKQLKSAFDSGLDCLEMMHTALYSVCTSGCFTV